MTAKNEDNIPEINITDYEKPEQGQDQGDEMSLDTTTKKADGEFEKKQNPENAGQSDELDNRDQGKQFSHLNIHLLLFQMRTVRHMNMLSLRTLRLKQVF